MEQLPTVIALCGPAGSGKSTVADYLVLKYGASRYGFATPLKEMVKNALGFTHEQVYGTQEQKEAVDPRYGRSARWFLQRIGTEGCRGTFGVDFWTKQCISAIVRQNRALVVIEDMRFADESEVLLDHRCVNGFVWRLWPVADAETDARAASAGVHASEQEWQQLDAGLEFAPETRGVDQLYALADAAMAMIPVRERSAGAAW